MPQERDLITRAQAALLPPACDEATIIRAEKRGELTPITMGGRRGRGIRVYYRLKEVVKWKNGGYLLFALFVAFTLLKIIGTLDVEWD